MIGWILWVLLFIGLPLWFLYATIRLLWFQGLVWNSAEPDEKQDARRRRNRSLSSFLISLIFLLAFFLMLQFMRGIEC